MRAILLLSVGQPIQQFIQFVALFLTAGAVGFRYTALRGRMAASDHEFFQDAAKRAAILGLIGGVVSLVLAATGLPGAATKAHMTIAQYIPSSASPMLQYGMLVLMIVGFLVAAARMQWGWPLALIGLFVGNLRSAFIGPWSRLANPGHALAAGLWLGTLFVLVTAGLSALLKHEPTRDRRGAIAADMVNAFSPMALIMGGVVVLLGLTIAWNHLPTLDALWTSTYGIVLIIKLVFVAIVFGLGAWNWRRQRPLLGSESAAIAIRRSARAELTFTLIVLIVTAILVSVPSPKG